MINRFGTKSDMIIQAIEMSGTEYQLAIDEKGLYLTSMEYVDRPIADPNRYSTVRHETADKLKDLDMDAKSIYAQNQHMVKRLLDQTRKKVNPLKASKRRAHSA